MSYYDSNIDIETFRGCVDYSPQSRSKDVANPERLGGVPVVQPNQLRTTFIRLCECSDCTPAKRAHCGKPKSFSERFGIYNYREILEA